MSTSKYVAPRRKKRVFCTLEAPFPVPIAIITSEPASSDRWFYYTAYLSGKCVVVQHSGDIDFLYKMGFFGKGNLSRSQPEFNRRFRTVRIPHPADTDAVVQPRVVSRRVYKNHVSWSGKGNNTIENLSDTSDISDDEEENLVVRRQMETCKPNVEENDKPETFQSVIRSENHSDASESDVKAAGKMEWMGDDDFWGSTDPAVTKPEESWEGEANADFWGVNEEGRAGGDGDGGTGGGDGDQGGVDNQGRAGVEDEDRIEGGDGTDGTGGEGVKQSRDESWGVNEGREGVCRFISQKDSRNIVNCERWYSNSKNINTGDCDTIVTEHVHTEHVHTEHVHTEHVHTEHVHTEHVHSEELSLDGENDQNTTKHFCKIGNTQTDMQACDSFPNTMDTSSNTNTETSMPSDKQELSPPDENYHQGDNDTVKLDPQCQEDDLQGDIFVVADSDNDESNKKKGRVRGKRWRPVLKTDPYPIIEHLQLCFEEAFFLSYGLGCLVVIDETQAQLNLVSLWRRFYSSRTNFLQNYIAYHYYRSKGWVPKTGLKFGCDFIVYKEGPPFYHASYSVMVKMVDQDTLTEDPSLPHRNLSWIALSGLNRITEHVAKELLLCYVIKPRGITEEELSSPACIPRFKVQEILVSRWVSSQERQEKDDEEFP